MESLAFTVYSLMIYTILSKKLAIFTDCSPMIYTILSQTFTDCSPISPAFTTHSPRIYTKLSILLRLALRTFFLLSALQIYHQLSEGVGSAGSAAAKKIIKDHKFINFKTCSNNNIKQLDI